ncbi:lymphocyte-specific protein 1 isoform X2 [Oryctolagus cuniculus]|uniref:lymphocyte-specific protein 1 isoform X2 n=1 Tax=Oryctolagus cuniculus TaxID=9986 RepID=UPI003879122C
MWGCRLQEVGYPDLAPDTSLRWGGWRRGVLPRAAAEKWGGPFPWAPAWTRPLRLQVPHSCAQSRLPAGPSLPGKRGPPGWVRQGRPERSPEGGSPAPGEIRCQERRDGTGPWQAGLEPLETLGCQLTTQWGAEDEEETAREPLQQLQAQDHRAAGQAPEQEIPPGLKPLQAPEPDEDEGFSDWSQRPEQRQQSWGSSDSGDPAQGESPEREQESRPLQDGGEVNQAKDHLEGLCLSQQGPGPGDTRPCNAGVAEADGAEEGQQPRTPSPSPAEAPDEPRSPPLSPTGKLVDRTESLSRSVEKSSPKKAQPTLPVARIDERLEQYTQAVETAGRTPRLARQTSIELPSMAVASTKSRWETGEVQAQSAAKATSCKDIVAGDMSKRSFWEQKEGSKTSSTLKSTPSGKRYKFVATGHGKYEKVLVDEGAAP